MEPILGGGLLFVATHSGNVYALRSETGDSVWRFQAHGPFLHSPAYAEGTLVAGSTDGRLYGLEAATGKLRWSVESAGGFAASPTIAGGRVFIGSRGGEMLAIELASGKTIWRQLLGAPVRQTAATGGGRVFVAAEDLRLRAFDAGTGKILWSSEPMPGQSARDYFPVLFGNRVFVTTNPIEQFSRRIIEDRAVLTRNAGIEDDDWRKVDAWIKSDAARGSPALWEKEQAAVVRHLATRPEARCLFVFDAESGKEAPPAPVLYIGGNQGVPAPPVAMPDGRLLVFYRSAYSNWNYGVAPLVAIGGFDPVKNRIEPIFHESGRQPPWNTFWGTADESQTFLLAGRTLLFIHQSTISTLNLETRKLAPLTGDRDGWGGFRNLPWARNEWNGPARGGVALAGGRLYWLTGSRVHAYAPGRGKPGEDTAIDGASVPAQRAPDPGPPALRERLRDAVEEVLSRRWAPLYVEPGLTGRQFFFTESGELFEALALAFPHLPDDLQARVRERLADEWAARPPFSKEALYPLGEGERREYVRVPSRLLSRLGHDKPPPPFGGAYAAWLYATRLDEFDRVKASWAGLKAAFEDFEKSPEQGLLFVNRSYAALSAFAKLAEKFGEPETAARAAARAAETGRSIVAWWKQSADRAELRVIRDINEWDRFLGSGDALFFRIIPHHHKIALFRDLTPELAARLVAEAPEAVEKIWRTFEALCATWFLAGEERQVHFGENSVDPPDFLRDAFRAYAWLRRAPALERARRVDIPFARADLAYVLTLALALEMR